MPEDAFWIEKPNRMRPPRLTGVVLWVLLLPVVRPVKDDTAVQLARLAEAKGESVLLVGRWATLAGQRSEPVAPGRGAMDTPGEQANLAPASSLLLDHPLRWSALQLVCAEVRYEEVRTGAAARMEVEVRHPSAGAPPDHPPGSLPALHLVLVSRGDRPATVRVSDGESIWFRCGRWLAVGMPGSARGTRACRADGRRCGFQIAGHRTPLRSGVDDRRVSEEAELEVAHGRRACAGYPSAVTARRHRSPWPLPAASRCANSCASRAVGRPAGVISLPCLPLRKHNQPK